MDIRELMIGDYVYITEDEEPQIGKVVGIKSIQFSDCWVVELFQQSKPVSWYGEKKVEPIPLTKEMLLANEWRDDLTLQYEKKNFYYNGLKLYPYGGLWLTTYSGNNQCVITYVHELQRLMRGLKVHNWNFFKLEC